MNEGRNKSEKTAEIIEEERIIIPDNERMVSTHFKRFKLTVARGNLSASVCACDCVCLSSR